MTTITEYDAVDSLQALQLNLLCLDFALTPELVNLIRRMDPRPFPCFTLYAVEGDAVAGQVGVFRLPTVSVDGAAEVGGVWAVATHPAFRGQGVASRLLDEAHARMAATGLRFSTLGTDRYRVAHALYRKHGYRDVASPARVLARSDQLPPANLRAERAGVAGLPLADHLFEQLARPYLGFARRHTPFFAFLHERHYLRSEDLWLLWREEQPVGYAAASGNGTLLRVHSLLLDRGVDPAAAVAGLAQAAPSVYVQARVDRPGDLAAFVQAGFQAARQDWGVFMVKPLAADATVEQFRQLYGVDSNRFLWSYMDVT